jgi:hypothetical protein
MNKQLLMIAALGGTLLVAGCGGDDDGGSGDFPTGAVALATTADANREMNNAFAFMQDISDEIGNAGAAPSSLPSGNAVAKRAKAASSCESSGTHETVEGEGTRDFSLLGVNGVPVDYVKTTLNNCKYVSGSYSSTEHGNLEAGYSGVLAGGDQLFYLTMGGSNGQPFVETEQSTGWSATYSSQMLLEMRQKNEEQGEVRVIGQYEDDESWTDGSASGTYTGKGRYGEEGTPIIVSYNADMVKILDFTLAYESSECAGGKVTMLTPTGHDIDLQGGYPRGGKLEIRSGDNKAVYTFNTDGSATLHLNDGVGTSLSAEAVQTAIDSDPC